MTGNGADRPAARSARLLAPPAAVLALVAACATGGGPNAIPTTGETSLYGRTWYLEDIAGRGVIDRLNTPLTFEPEGRVAGDTGCNRFMGAVEVAEGSMRFGLLAATRRACPGPVMDQEQRLLSAFGEVRRWRIDDGGLLHLEGDDGADLLRFAP